jgi:hypothetical protein
VVAHSDNWQGTIDGSESCVAISGIGTEAVYAFKDERLAAFDAFAMLIPGTERMNVDEFELLVSREASSGPFASLGKFHTQNLRIFAAPYQTFTFPLVEAKYLKVKIISNYGYPGTAACEFQLFGTLFGLS